MLQSDWSETATQEFADEDFSLLNNDFTENIYVWLISMSTH